MAGGLVHLVSLGCAKNRVDSEVLLGTLLAAGMDATDEPEEADLIVVNTCGFIQPAVEESLDVILGLARIRASRPSSRLVVVGCLPQRHGEDLAQALPEVDLFLGTGGHGRLLELIEAPPEGRCCVGCPGAAPMGGSVRAGRAMPHMAWLKVSEGCHRRCTYCMIPRLRGALRSQPAHMLLEEARFLVDDGVRELGLVAQDVTAYGHDLPGGDDLAALLERLDEVDGLTWVRVLYAHPLGLTERLMDVMASAGSVCRYLDIPLQHASTPILTAMGRRLGQEDQDRILQDLRSRIPGISLRTTVMVGFPGETEGDLQVLLDFLSRHRFERLGVFPFWPEEGTPAALLPRRLPDDVVAERQETVVNHQAAIMGELQEAMIGATRQVMVDGPSEEHPWVWQGRLEGQAPEVDGVVFLQGDPARLRPGELVTVRLVDATEVDLVGDVVSGP